MNGVSQRIAARLLEAAVRRWPAHLREELRQEWAGELHALGHEAGVVAPVRMWRQLRFAASLALARPPGADAVSLPWLGNTGWLFLAPLLTLVAALAALVPLQVLPFGWVTYTPTSTALFVIENYLVEVALAAVVGTLLARRLLRRRAGRPVSVAGCGWATLPLIAGLLAVDVLARGTNQVWDGGLFAIVAALCLAALLPPLAAGVAALSARGRRGLAITLAAVAAPALTLAISYAMVLLAPQTPAAAAGRPWWWLAYLGREPILSISYYEMDDPLPIETVLPVLPGFVLTAVVLALAHAIRLARPLSSAAATAPTATEASQPSDIPTVARDPWWHRTALAGAIYSVLAWAVTLTYLTPNIGVQSSWPSRVTPDGRLLPEQPAGWPQWTSEEGRLWMHELQLSAIVCAALCLLCAAAYRGRPVLPTLAGSIALLAVNMVVVRGGWTTPRLLPWLAAGGLILGIAAWSASTRRRPIGRPRRLVITITVLAAFLVPGSFFPRVYVADRQAPPALLLVAVGLPTILTILAAMGVLATSTLPPRRPLWRLPATLALLPAVGGVLYYHDRLGHVLTGQPSLAILFIAVPLGLAVPVVVWTIAAISGRRVSLFLAPPLFLAGLAVAAGTIASAAVLARLLLFPMEYGQTYDGLPYVPGAVAGGLLLGYVTAVRLDRARSPIPSVPG